MAETEKMGSGDYGRVLMMSSYAGHLQLSCVFYSIVDYLQYSYSFTGLPATKIASKFILQQIFVYFSYDSCAFKKHVAKEIAEYEVQKFKKQ